MKRYFPFAIALSSAVVLAACSQSADPTPSDSAAPSSDAAEASASPSAAAEPSEATESAASAASQAEAIAAMPLPTDEYFEYDWLLFHAGQAKALNECLVSKELDLGLPEVVYDEASAKEAMGFERKHYVLTEERAKERGYRRLIPPAAFKPFEDRINEVLPTLGYFDSQKLAQCSASIAQEKPFLYPFDAEDYAAFEVDPEPPQEPTWVATKGIYGRADDLGPWRTAIEWRKCMEPYGFEVGNFAPVHLPTDEMRQAWYLNDTQTFKQRNGTPPPEEIEYALKDVACRESSGYTKRAHELQIEYLEKDIAEHKDRYENIKRKIAEKTPQVKEYLGIP